ncbi:MAG: hypothetical protein J6W64_00245 [Bacilli bacterium]|nr:hypothetical protein [Bacilli bacterium]
MSMFDNFTHSTTISFNRPDYHYDDNTGDIVIGATNEHTFNAPFLLSEYCTMFDIIYKQGLTTVLIKRYNFEVNEEVNEKVQNGIEVKECDEKEFSIVKVTLTPPESNMFKNSVLECQAQMKLYMPDNEILYSDAYDIDVKSPLDNENAI